jgi:antirestriction protein
MLKVALTNLGKYNEGELVYQWLELPATDEEIVRAMWAIGMDGEEYEEYFISDYETDIEGLEVGEYENLDELNSLVERYEDLGEYDQEAVQAIMEAEGYNFEESLDKVEQGYFTFYSGQSLEDVAYEMVDEGLFGDIADNLKNYIDYEAIARDIRLDGYSETKYGVICIQ